MGRSGAEATPKRVLVEPPPDDLFKPKVEDICGIYATAQERAQTGEVTVSIDEMTGIQALERTMPDLAMKPGRKVKREFEYIRHGTQSLIASFNVATGEIAWGDGGRYANLA